MALTLDRKTPGIFGIFFGATLSIALGATLAVVNLAAQAVEVLSSPPKEPVPGTTYYIQGAGGSVSGLDRKEDQLKKGTGEVGITEAELNAWSSATFKPVEVKKEDKADTVMIIAGKPNFRLVGKELQVGSVNTVNFFGSEAPLVLQARGVFVRANSGVRFQPNTAYLGALPLHRLPALIPLVAERFGAGSTLPPAVDKVLKGASEMSVRDGELVVRMP